LYTTPVQINKGYSFLKSLEKKILTCTIQDHKICFHMIFIYILVAYIFLKVGSKCTCFLF
jgi:hypothetical protein